MICCIYEENPEVKNMFREAAVAYAIRSNLDLDIMWYSESAINHIEKYAEKMQLAFISLDLGTGISFGQQIYSKNPDCLICYYSRQGTELYEIVKTRPRDIILGCPNTQKIDMALSEMIHDCLNSSSHFVLNTRRKLICECIRSIVYLQSNLKYVYIKRIDGSEEPVYAKLDDLVQTAGPCFVRVHKSYLVNILHIRSLIKTTHTLELDNGESIPISDSYYETVLKNLNYTSSPIKNAGRTLVTG